MGKAVELYDDDGYIIPCAKAVKMVEDEKAASDDEETEETEEAPAKVATAEHVKAIRERIKAEQKVAEEERKRRRRRRQDKNIVINVGAEEKTDKASTPGKTADLDAAGNADA